MSTIARVGIIGAGTMGTVIALRCALSGKETNIFSAPPQTLQTALARIRTLLADTVSDRKATSEEADRALARVHVCASVSDCVAGVDLVIEAVPEQMDLKRSIFAEVDGLAARQTLIATASSSIRSSRLADATGRPSRVLNLHFYQSIDAPVVEVMANSQTSAETMAAGEEFVRTLGMLPLVVKREIMGFGTNTIWHQIKKAALRIVGDGHMGFEDIDRHWMLTSGPLPPFARMDKVGLDVVRDIEMEYYRDSGDERDRPPQFLDTMISQGRLGVKSGRGFYTYPDAEYVRPGWLRKELPWAPDMTIRVEGILN